jgi:hypothetical protein
MPSYCFFETGSPYADQDGLELKIILPLPPECSDYRHIPPCPAMSLLLMVKCYSVVCIYQVLFIHSFLDGNFGFPLFDYDE